MRYQKRVQKYAKKKRNRFVWLLLINWCFGWNCTAHAKGVIMMKTQHRVHSTPTIEPFVFCWDVFVGVTAVNIRIFVKDKEGRVL